VRVGFDISIRNSWIRQADSRLSVKCCQAAFLLGDDLIFVPQC
jgi:hypothetical protein